MRAFLIGISVVLFSAPCRADFTATGNSQVAGQVGVGTLIPQAQLQVQDDPTDTYAIRVSSANGSVMFVVLPNGNIGLGLAAPKTHLDVNGSGDNSDLALQLRVGNSSNTLLSQQIVFASTAGTYGHALVTQATPGQTAGNTIDFFLWNSTGQPNDPASLNVLTLAAPSLSTASVHIDPFGTPVAQLEVSNGACTGCGTIIRAAAQAPSSRERKTDITYLDPARKLQAYTELNSLRHAKYRYKMTNRGGLAGGPVIRGLIYEDSPESIRGANNRIVLDNRVMNLELALQAADNKIEALEAEIRIIESRKTNEADAQDAMRRRRK